MGDIKYADDFSYWEFACKCGRCGVSGREVKRELVESLQVVRTIYARPITFSSGVRCPTHNKNEGGKIDSGHLFGEAVDIDVGNSRDRYDLLRLLLVNFTRVGIGDDFIHVDITSAKAQQVAWTY